MSLTKEELLEYLKMALDMEEDLYTKKELLEKLEKEYHNNEYLSYSKKPLEERVFITKFQLDSNKSGFTWLGIGIGAFILDVIFFSPTTDVAAILFLFAIVAFFIGLGKTILALMNTYYSAKSSITGRICAVTGKAERARRYEDDLKKWQTEAEEINKENTKRGLAQAVLKVNINAVEDQYSSARKTLDEIYAINIIHPKYRNLIAVSSLYEYFDTGRCTELEGATGAYNLFENESRLDRILVKMDKIIVNLDAIRNSQYQLYTAITSANNSTANLLASISRNVQTIEKNGQDISSRLSNIEETGKIIKVNSDIIGYNTKRAQKELEFSNRMKYLRGAYDDPVYFNHNV